MDFNVGKSFLYYGSTDSDDFMDFGVSVEQKMTVLYENFSIRNPNKAFKNMAYTIWKDRNCSNTSIKLSYGTLVLSSTDVPTLAWRC